MVQNKQVELLQHPLVATLLNRKWAKFGAIMYILSLLLFVGLVIFITSFALAVPHPLSDACKHQNSTTRECGDTSRAGLFFTAVVTVIMCGVSLLWWVLRFIQPYQKDRARGGHYWSVYINWKYWRDWRTYINLEVPLLILTLLFVSVFHEDCLCPERWQWRVGIVAVFLAWVRLFVVLHQFPTIGVYAGMMLTIVLEFLRVLVMATLLIVSFGITFYMAFYEPDIPASPFRTPWNSIVSIVVYMAGGPDNSVFRLDNEGSGAFDSIPFPVVSYTFWIIFIVIMSILFLNFLTGLAVGDVQDVRNSANLQRLTKKVKFLLSLEQKYIPFRTQNLTKSIHPNAPVFSRGWKDHLQNFWRWEYIKRYWRKLIWSFTKEEDLTNIVTTETLLYPEEKQTEVDKVKTIVQAIAKKNDEHEENLREVLAKLTDQESEMETVSSTLSDKFEEQEKTIKAVLSKLDDQEKLLKEILGKLSSSA